MRTNGNIKTVKGGFKPEKLVKKKFELNSINNPFAIGNDSESEPEEQQQELETQEVETPAPKTEEKA